MAQWDDLHPGRGVTSAVNDAATRVSNRSTGTETVRSALANAATSTTDEVWAGDAGAAFRTSLTKPQNLCTELTTEFAAVQSALTAYAAEVDRIRAATAAAHQAYANGYATWKAAEAEESPFPLSTYTFNAPSPTLQPGLWVPSGTTAGLADMRQAANQLKALATQRETADSTLVAALAPPASPRWDAMQSALSFAGIDDIDDLNYDNLGDAFANVADEIAEGDITDENLQAMQDFFDVWGDDTFVMSQFFLEVGGENTVSMIDNLGDAVMVDGLAGATALALATSIRGGLSTGSQIWMESTSKDFAESMLTGASSSVGGAVAAIGFLFSDEKNHPLGVNLTVAMADEIDRIERDPASMLYGGWTDFSPNAGGRTLAFLEGEQTGLDGNRVDDLAGRIFSTLGTYPDAALDWLTSTENDPFGDGDLGDGRIEYWFGERDWSANSSGDGFEGPGALWAGAQQAAGGPADATHTYNPETWQRVAELTTQVVRELTGNESFLPENLTSIGQVRVAEGISVAMPYFSEAISESDPAAGTRPYFENLLIGTDDPRAIPDVTQAQLAQLLGTAAWSDGDTPSAGAAVIAQSVQQYQDALIAIADLAPADSAFKADALERVVELQGWLDGSPAGAALGEATRHDEAVQAAIDGVGTVVGLIPIPAVGDVLVAGGSVVIDVAQSAVIGGVSDWGSGQATAAWANSHEALLEAQADAANGREIATMETIEQMLVDLGMTEGLSAGQVDDLAREMFADYQRGVEANTSWAEGT
ncbi:MULTISPECIES: hypothetical protein [Microbacterium]|uniref:WXG100 family type VII secretion target n=1 Tax=Microbacterium sufflavum TaxID=2851649 RepID=A0ABY4IEP4_9MICO|nr:MULTISPECIES: hypothetical protein [Microbacterium]MBN6190942.1 hypothetical protein [Aneurinibacillus sp. BA2021]UPL11017.1 hypothetical protein KV394_07785 [Microbacterium sufflavum]